VVPQPVVQLMAVLQQAVLAALALRVARLTAVPQRMEPVDSGAGAANSASGGNATGGTGGTGGSASSSASGSATNS